jgi:hypothetical protein
LSRRKIRATLCHVCKDVIPKHAKRLAVVFLGNTVCHDCAVAEAKRAITERMERESND